MTTDVRQTAQWMVASDGSLGHDAACDWRFAQPVIVRGFVLPRLWDKSGLRMYAKDIEVSFSDAHNGPLQLLQTFTVEMQESPARVVFAAPLRAYRVFLRVVRMHSQVDQAFRRVRTMSLLSHAVPWKVFHDVHESVALITDGESPQNLVFPDQGDLHGANSYCQTLAGPGWQLGCSLQRPILYHFGWDGCGTGAEAKNQLFLAPEPQQANALPGCSSGPVWRDGNGFRDGRRLGGTVAHAEAWVSYQLSPADDVVLQVTFRRDHQGFILDLTLDAHSDRVFEEASAWRLVFDGRLGIVSVLAAPLPPQDRMTMGRCRLPAMITAINRAVLSLELVDGDGSHLYVRTDSWRKQGINTCDIELGVVPEPGGHLRLVPGKHHVSLRLRPCAAEAPGAEHHDAMRRQWLNVFGFRPEFYGLSNNALSARCLFCSHVWADMAFAMPEGPQKSLAVSANIWSLNLSFAGGQGYGYDRSHWLETPASLTIAACVLAEICPSWNQKAWQGICNELEHILASFGDRGLLVVRTFTDQVLWSSNWWDVVGFSWEDAWTNALAYRALVLASRLGHKLGKHHQAEQFRLAAERIERSYVATFLTPSGRLAGWRDRNGVLHDSCYLFVNGLAVVHGLVRGEQARQLVYRIEQLRLTRPRTEPAWGLPGNLLPLPLEDQVHPVPYGAYMNGGLTWSMSYPWLRAASIAGVPAQDALITAGLDAFAAGIPFGGVHQGYDWRTPDGRPTGYEGVLSDQFYALLAFAQHKGWAGPSLGTVNALDGAG